MKKFVIATGCVVSLGLVAIGVQQFNVSADEPALTLEEAKKKATEEYPGEVLDTELEAENGKKVYEIEIKGDTYTYDLELAADSGKVVKLEEKEKIEKPTEGENQTNNGKKTAVTVTEKEAQDIALKETGGEIVESELDEDDGLTYYEFEIKTKQGEAEVEVHAYTGEIIQISYDDDDEDDE